MKVREQVCEFTYACGTGAISAFGAANKLGFVKDKAEVIFELGSLHMKMEKTGVSMTGPGTYVFSGDYLAPPSLFKKKEKTAK